MTFLTTAELSQLQSDLEELLPDTCRIERPTTTNTSGSISQTWGTAVASVACRFDPDNVQSQSGEVALRETGIARYTVTLPYDADVRDDDRLVHNSATYNIVTLYDLHSARGVRRARVEAVR
jgi:head-tail adaptor